MYRCRGSRARCSQAARYRHALVRTPVVSPQSQYWSAEGTLTNSVLVYTCTYVKIVLLLIIVCGYAACCIITCTRTCNGCSWVRLLLWNTIGDNINAALRDTERKGKCCSVACILRYVPCILCSLYVQSTSEHTGIPGTAVPV